jgi:hypothetical protein
MNITSLIVGILLLSVAVVQANDNASSNKVCPECEKKTCKCEHMHKSCEKKVCPKCEHKPCRCDRTRRLHCVKKERPSRNHKCCEVNHHEKVESDGK